MGERCMAATGTVWTGPLYCGNRAKTTDPNGRPICGVHKRGQPGTLWLGDRGNYPEGTGDERGRWQFAKGKPRS